MTAEAPAERTGAPTRVTADAPWEGEEGRLVLEPVAVAAPHTGEGAAAHEGEGVAPHEGEGAAPHEGEGTASHKGEGAAPHKGRVGLPESWAREGLEVRFRVGGERFKPAGDAHHRTLKAWFQQRGIVPWMRARIPLLYRDGRLVAVADLALAEEAHRARPDEPRWRVRWLDYPGLID